MRLATLRDIDVNLLVALHVLLEECSVTRAAEHMEVSQSAMSRTLGRLRELLGDPLLVRSAHQMERTAVAEDLRGPLAEVLQRLDALVTERAAFEPATSTRSFRLQMTDHAAVVVLPGLVSVLRQHAPGVDIELAPLEGVAEQHLLQRHTELFVGARSLETPGLYRQALFEESFVCVLRADHPARDAVHELARYAELDHVMIAPRGTSRGGFVDDALAERGLVRRIVLRVPQFLVAPLVVAQSDLVATVPLRAAKALERQGLALVPPPIELPTFTVHQVWHERHHHDHGHRWLRQTVAAVMHDEGL
ncbi:MAG: LysR family transcriptional regulator [Nannocystaceae bacterium]